MNSPPLSLSEAPKLSDESASEILEFLYLLLNAFENQYGHQIRRHYQSFEPQQPPQPDLFEDFDDGLPDF